MATERADGPQDKSPKATRSPQSVQKRPPDQARAPIPDPAGQSPDDPIEFTSDSDVARGNEERANAEPEPPALHDAEVPGKPGHHDAAKQRT